MNFHLLLFRPALTLALSLCACVSIAAGPTPVPPEEAGKEGRALVAEVLSQHPAANATNTGLLKIRSSKKTWTEIPITFQTIVGEAGWRTVYRAGGTNAKMCDTLVIEYRPGGSNVYSVQRSGRTYPLEGNQAMTPFAGSDFWAADLGLEFLHWPDQRVLTHEMRRGRSCRVLESVNPHPSAGAYSKVDSWIDIDTDGIVHADAFDFNGKLLKEFDPKEFTKVQGQWQLEEMQIDNRQTGSRTRVEFKLD